MLASTYGFANDRTNPITPALVAAYTGAIGKGYKPAFDAVQMISPRLEPVDAGFLFM